MVLQDLVSLLLRVQRIVPRKGSLALRPSGVKMGLGLLSMLQSLLQTECASWLLVLQYHTIMFCMCVGSWGHHAFLQDMQEEQHLFGAVLEVS